MYIYFYYEYITQMRLHNHRIKLSGNKHKYSLWRDMQSIFQMNILAENWSLRTRDTLLSIQVIVHPINCFVILGESREYLEYLGRILIPK